MAQFIRLTGVLDDGSLFGSETPKNTAVTIQFPRGADITIEVTVVNNAGAAVDLTQDAALLAWISIVRFLSCLPRYDLRIQADPVSPVRPNVLVFHIQGSKTQCLDLGRYYFDLAMVFLANNYEIIRTSTLHLEPGLGLRTKPTARAVATNTIPVIVGTGTVESDLFLPFGANVTDCLFRVNDVYSPGASVSVGNDTDPLAYMLTTDNVPQVSADYDVPQNTPVGSPSRVKVTVSGAPLVGDGVVLVSFTS